jgi:hypothetical protein
LTQAAAIAGRIAITVGFPERLRLSEKPAGHTYPYSKLSETYEKFGSGSKLSGRKQYIQVIHFKARTSSRKA